MWAGQLFVRNNKDTIVNSVGYDNMKNGFKLMIAFSFFLLLIWLPGNVGSEEEYNPSFLP
jgi:hypothetical protein